MDVSATLTEIRSLSVQERLRIVEAIWDSIEADSEDLELTPAQREMLERRLAAHAANPDAVVPWEVVKAEALARIRR
jgi:putative addiction module component (TIGR02574 family)